MHIHIPSYNPVYFYIYDDTFYNLVQPYLPFVDYWSVFEINVYFSSCSFFQGGAMAGEVACLSSMTQGKVKTGCIYTEMYMHLACDLCFCFVLSSYTFFTAFIN